MHTVELILSSNSDLQDEFVKEKDFPLQPGETPVLLQEVLLQAPDIFQRQGTEHFNLQQGKDVTSSFCRFCSKAATLIVCCNQ